MEEKQEIDQKYIEKLEEHIKSTKEIMKYSLERFDILIISLSSGGLIFSINIVKDLLKGNSSVLNDMFLRAAWIFFLFSLISNLISQVTGYYCSKNEICVSEDLIRAEKKKKSKYNKDKLSRMSSLLNKCTMYLNGFSLLTLILGLISLVILSFRHL